MSKQESKSNLYYLLPAFLTIFGGIIALLILRKSDPKKGRNCVILGLIASGFAIGFDAVAETFDIPVGDYIETYGVTDFIGGMSIYVIPPIVIVYCIIRKIQQKIVPQP
jgi:hypothetical protein